MLPIYTDHVLENWKPTNVHTFKKEWVSLPQQRSTANDFSATTFMLEFWLTWHLCRHFDLFLNVFNHEVQNSPQYMYTYLPAYLPIYIHIYMHTCNIHTYTYVIHYAVATEWTWNMRKDGYSFSPVKKREEMELASRKCLGPFSLFSPAVINTRTKRNMGKKGFILVYKL